MAWVSDQTKSRYGRRRPYILVGAPFYALFLTLFFSPPANMSGEALDSKSRGTHEGDKGGEQGTRDKGTRDLREREEGGGGGGGGDQCCNSQRTAM